MNNTLHKLDRLTESLQCNNDSHHRASCSPVIKLADATKIQMLNFCIRMWIFILNSTNKSLLKRFRVHYVWDENDMVHS